MFTHEHIRNEYACFVSWRHVWTTLFKALFKHVVSSRFSKLTYSQLKLLFKDNQVWATHDYRRYNSNLWNLWIKSTSSESWEFCELLVSGLKKKVILTWIMSLLYRNCADAYMVYLTLTPKNLRARSQIPVVGLTGRAPGWPGALKLPGATV